MRRSIAFVAIIVPLCFLSWGRSVAQVNQPPVISAPAVVRAVPFAPLSIDVSVTDPDGDPIQDLNMDLELPGFFGATFDEAPDHTHGTFHWTPGTELVYTAGSTPLEIAFYASDDGVRIVSLKTIIYLSYIDIDHIGTSSLDLLVGNSGQTGYDVDHDRWGLFYPRGTSRSLLYAMGPWIGGKAAGSLRLSRGGANTELLPGTMTGFSATPFVPRFRNYRIIRNDPVGGDDDQWPSQDGAPVDEQGRPRLIGDQMIWSVYNEYGQRNRFGSGWEYDGGTAPAGLEIRQTTFTYAAVGPLADVTFARFEMTNRSSAPMDSAYAAVWADPDLGNSSDDLVGSDPTLGLGYVYNGPGSDTQYGDAPPAVGFALLPDEAIATGFSSYTGSSLIGKGLTPAKSFLMMQGKTQDGTATHRFDDPSQPVTTFRYDGDPVAGTGWLDSSPGDKRIVLSAGPFTLGANETKSYAVAILVGQGADRLASVRELKRLAPMVRFVALSGYALLPYVNAPGEVTVPEGATLNLPLEAMDLEGLVVTETADLPREMGV